MLSAALDRITISTGNLEETRIFVDDLLIGWEEADVAMNLGQVHTIRVERDGCSTTVIETQLVLNAGSVSLEAIDSASGPLVANAWRVEQNHYAVLPRCPSV